MLLTIKNNRKGKEVTYAKGKELFSSRQISHVRNSNRKETMQSTLTSSSSNCVISGASRVRNFQQNIILSKT